MSDKTNRVWIEIELDPTPEVNKMRAEKLSAVLQHLGCVPNVITFDESSWLYNRVLDTEGGYKQLLDSGDWFNLDFLATWK